MTEKPTSIRGMLSKELIAILLASATGFFSQELLSPVLSLYMRDVGLTDQNIGMLFSVMMVGIAISEVFWGWAVDRINMKYVLILGTGVYGIVTMALHLPRTFSAFIIVMLVYGFSRSPIYIVGRWYMGVHAPEDIKAQAFAFLMVSISITQSIASFGSGFFVEAWGFGTTIWVAALVPMAAGLLLILLGGGLDYKKPNGAEEEPANGENRPADVNGRARLITFFLGSFGVIMFVSLGVLMAYLPLYASDVVNLDPSRIGILFGLRGIIQILTMMPLGKLADRLGKHYFVPIGMAVVTLSMLVVVVSRSYSMLLLSVFLYAIGAGMYFPSVTAILSDNVPVSWVGTAMGIYGLLEDVGWMIGPAVGGLLLNYWDIRSPFVFSALVALLAIPLFAWGRRFFEPVGDLEPAGEFGGQPDSLAEA